MSSPSHIDPPHIDRPEMPEGYGVPEHTEGTLGWADVRARLEASAQYYPDDAHARRLLHVGATRAAHQLWLTSVGTPSPVLREVMG